MPAMNDRVALITGGSRGIGRATALLMAEAGCDVAINYRIESGGAAQVTSAVEGLGRRALAVRADVSDSEQVDAMIHHVMEEFGKLDILVNNAGIWERNPTDTMTEESLKRTIDVNLLGTFYTIMSSVPRMKKHGGGSIINVSSTAGQRGEPFYSPYAASKGAIISLTKSLSVELASSNIRVNCVAPGWIETDMSRDALMSGEGDKIRMQIPLRRVGTPEEVATSIVFLASDDASFITGEIINVNGGAVLCG